MKIFTVLLLGLSVNALAQFKVTQVSNPSLENAKTCLQSILLMTSIAVTVAEHHSETKEEEAEAREIKKAFLARNASLEAEMQKTCDDEKKCVENIVKGTIEIAENYGTAYFLKQDIDEPEKSCDYLKVEEVNEEQE